MATGRTLPKWWKVYADGFDVSGMSRAISPLGIAYQEVDMTAHMGDVVKGYLTGHPQVNVGTLNGVFDNTATTGTHTVLQTAGGKRTLLVAMGIRGAPAEGDPCFAGQFLQKDYYATPAGGGVYTSIPFSGWAVDAAAGFYGRPFGNLLHANTAETAVNTAIAVVDEGASTTKGGYLVYHVTAGNGTATIAIEDAATNTNPSFAALSGATTGSINCAVVQHGLVALSATATVRRFLRWQIAFGTATTVSFVLGFHRG